MKLYEIDYYNLQDLLECDSSSHKMLNNCSKFVFEGSFAHCLLKIEELCKENDWFYEKDNFEELDIRKRNNHLQVNTYFNNYKYTISRVFIITSKNDFKVIGDDNYLYNGILYQP